MAKGLIIDDDYGRLARAYYQRFGTEPVDATIGIAAGRVAKLIFKRGGP